jgi:hypothetical protein
VISGSLVCAVGTAGLGLATDLPWLLATSFLAGLGSGMFTPTQQAAVADIIGPKARGGPVLAGFQMAADLGTVIGPVAVGALAQQVSYGLALGVTGALLAVAALVWTVVPEPLRRGIPAHSEMPSERSAGADDAGRRSARIDRALNEVSGAPVADSPVPVVAEPMGVPGEGSADPQVVVDRGESVTDGVRTVAESDGPSGCPPAGIGDHRGAAADARPVRTAPATAVVDSDEAEYPPGRPMSRGKRRRPERRSRRKR